ncbi:unnamed protein product, partial [Gulo gulo]
MHPWCGPVWSRTSRGRKPITHEWYPPGFLRPEQNRVHTMGRASPGQKSRPF